MKNDDRDISELLEILNIHKIFWISWVPIESRIGPILEQKLAGPKKYIIGNFPWISTQNKTYIFGVVSAFFFVQIKCSDLIYFKRVYI